MVKEKIIMKKVRVLALLAFSAGLAACSGSSGGGNNDKPQGVTVSPANGATGVSVTNAISATFREDMIATTIDTDSFTLLRNDKSVKGEVKFNPNNNTAIFSPDKPLALLSRYTAYLTTAIADLNGKFIKPHNWSFMTGDGSWGKAEKLTIKKSSSPEVHVDFEGGISFSWFQEGAPSEYWTKRYQSTANEVRIWSEPEKTSWRGVTTNSNVRGEKFSVLTKNSGLESSHYTIEGGWSAPVTIPLAPLPVTIEHVAVVIDEKGNGLALWTQFPDNFQDGEVWRSRYLAEANTWSAPEVLAGSYMYARKVQLVANTNGNAVALWNQRVPGQPYSAIWVSNYAEETNSWSEPEELEGTQRSDGNPRLAISANGDALVVWGKETEHNSQVNNIWVNSFNAATNLWSSPGRLQRDQAISAYDADLAMNLRGSAITVWKEEGDDFDSFWANQFSAEHGWGGPKFVLKEKEGGGYFGEPKVVVDVSGNALLVWEEKGGGASSRLRANVILRRQNPGGLS